MKATFKPLSLAVAVAAAGVAGTSNAQMDLAAETGLGDLALVPYYTVNNDWTSGVSVINTSDRTQVIKIRLRRAADSMDALDFNVVMSPNDVWTGYLQEFDEEPTNSAGEPILGAPNAIQFVTKDTSCTVPALKTKDLGDGNVRRYLEMPDIYRTGAETGYIEIMGMGSPISELEPIAEGALHDEAIGGLPEDCDNVRENFKRGSSPADYYASALAFDASTSTRTSGVINSELTMQPTGKGGTPEFSNYEDGGNFMRVSYFIRDTSSGTEFGNAAVHISDFLDGAAITNQKQGIESGDLQGFDHPNLNGGAPTSFYNFALGATYGRERYQDLREILGATQIINDWSANTTPGVQTVATDWIVTTPGQYLMTNLPGYIDSLEAGGVPCLAGTNPAAATYPTVLPGNNCDFRDLPLRVTATVYSREEDEITAEVDDLVVSPAPPDETVTVDLDREVNIVVWSETDDGTTAVINGDKGVLIPKPEGANAGWASVSVAATTTKTQAICEFLTANPAAITGDCEAVDAADRIPLIGFVAWERSFDGQQNANFGRIVEHAYFNRGASS